MPLDLADPIAVLLAAARAFSQAGLDAAAYGGLVLAMYGRPRETHDADLAVSLVSADAAQRALAAAGIEAVATFSETRFGGNLVSRMTLIGGGELNTVDLVRPRSPRYAKAVLERSAVGSLRSEELRVVSAEDYVLLKVLSTRERDLEDAASVRDKQGRRLDEGLLRREASLLAREVPDHDVSRRFSALLDRQGS